MKVKNVINGIKKQFEIEELNIITPSKVIYSGSLLGWTFTDVDMICYKQKVEKLEVVNRMIFNNKKLFLFVPEIETDWDIQT